MLKLWNVMLVWAAAIPTIVAQGTFTGTIRATDSQGRPVANAEAAPFWSILGLLVRAVHLRQFAGAHGVL
jgi:hypothetical protein